MMNDIDILNKIKIIIKKDFYYKLNNNICIELDLTSEDYIYKGLCRHSTIKEKREILKLIGKLTNLEVLNLRRCMFFNIDDNYFKLLPNLKFLDLGSNYLKNIPSSIKYLQKLEYLNLAVNELNKCPNIFEELSLLKKLNLHKNKFKILDESISSLKKLESLNIYGLNLKETPMFIFNLNNLNNLVLSHFNNIPREIENLHNLEYFTNNIAIKLYSLPDEFTSLKKLKMARIYQNSLKYLPKNFGNLKNLEQLSLYQNKLTELPSSFINLQKLEKLNLSWNQFTKFPKEIKSLQNLKWLGYYLNNTDIPDLNHIDKIITNRIEQ